MLSDKLRPVIEPATRAVGRGLAKAGLTANALTTIGLLATLACAWLIAEGWLLVAGLLLIPAAIIDVLDGALARATGAVSAWGGFYDSVCDRIGDNALLAGVLVLADRDGAWWAALAALMVTNLVPYARAKAEALGVRVASGPGERAERVVLLVAGLILGYSALTVSLWVITALSAWTFLARTVGVRSQTKA